MTKQCFVPKDFKDETLRTIVKANEIIDEYTAMGFSLTLRQLYYQFVARGYIENSQKSYKRLGDVINNARLAGLIDWEAIEDRTRYLRSVPTWNEPLDVIKSAAAQFRIDKWLTQPVYMEFWIEKDALVGVLTPVCEEFGVGLYACRGYSSQSEQWRAGRRFSRKHWQGGKRVVIFHLGDHDPSGLDMTRDNQDRLDMFSGSPVEVRRLALNMDQVDEFNPPPNPAKELDPRSGQYTARYGDYSWELDALSPDVIDGIARSNIEALIDREEWDIAAAQEADYKAQLRLLTENWDEVAVLLNAIDMRSGNGQA